MKLLKRTARIPNHFLNASRKRFTGDASTHIHDFFEMEYIISGKGVCIVDGRECPLTSGSLFLLSPANTHAVKDADAELINVMFECEYDSDFPLFSLLRSASAPYLLLSAQDRPFVMQLLSELVSVFPQNPRYARSLLQCLLHKLAYYAGSENAPLPLPYIQHAFLYLTENFRNGVSLESTAEHLGLSPTYLSDLFSKESNVTFQEYLDGLRFSHAKDLLSHTALPIGEVHRMAGFSDYSNFSRRFKKRYGMTPTEYRLGNPIG